MKPISAPAATTPHRDYEDAPITGRAYRDAASLVAKLFAARERITKIIATAADDAGFDPNAAAALILDGTISVETPSSGAPSVDDLRRHRAALDEALRQARNVKDEARRAAAREIADELRAGRFGQLEKDVGRARAELTVAQQALVGFAKTCRRDVAIALVGCIVE